MAGKKSTEVQAALALVAGGLNPYAAAKATGANEQSVYAAVRRAAAKPKAAEPAEPAPVASGNAALREAFRAIKADIAAAGPARRASIATELQALLVLAREPAAAVPSFARDYGDNHLPDIL